MKKASTPVPHDGLFKTFLTHPETARDFLELHLPPALREACDLSTLRLESGSFIEEDLRTYFADVLWSLKSPNGTGYVYALIEHQSSPDPLMAFRLMRYAIAAMQRHLDQGHDKLPLVIPMLFSHARTSPWPFTMDWTELFSEPELARQLYSGRFPLIDVGAMADDDIMKHRRMAMLELMLKHSRSRDLAELLKPLASLLVMEYTTEEQLATLMNWMLQTGNSANPRAFLTEMAQRSPQHEDVLMTIAQYLEQQGAEKGKREGRLEGKQEVAQAMLKNGIDRDAVLKMTGLSEEQLPQTPR